MGIISFKRNNNKHQQITTNRNMRNFIGAALIAFAVSTQARFLSGDVGRKLNSAIEYICKNEIDARDEEIKEVTRLFCQGVVKDEFTGAGKKLTCQHECNEDAPRTSWITRRGSIEFCDRCCN